MSISFCFGEFRANSICPIFREGHAKFLYDFDACMHFYNEFVYYNRVELTMVSGTMVDRWLRSAVQDMKENNQTEILCPCRRCKGGVWLDPYDDGRVEAHLLMTGFMDGCTRWIIEDEDDDVEDGAANTWDAAEKEYFPMRAALLTTVHDYLGYGYVAGQVVHGFSGCVRCMDDTTYR